MQDYSKILNEAYEKFLLPLGGKKVPTPYRINIPFQKDRKKYGKSTPNVLIKNTKQFAKEQNFNLDKASADEIRKFMIKNKLGIDCSGFAYHLLNHLLKKTGKGTMRKIGFPKASSTNVIVLTSKKFTVPVKNLNEVRTGDIISTNGGSHCLLVLENTNRIITYGHSSRTTKPTGVKIEKMKNGQLPTSMEKGDGIRRLKILR